ncbi:MAG: PDZ domain-containing protein, partial [Deltaproteobacteria bacterium]|nr:PDZ domain-containing protein [Kofleriaceae bacterium]
MRLAPSLVGLALALAAGGGARAETEAPPPPKPWLGIGFSADGYSAEVTDVHPATGAAAAGLLPGDRIVEIDGIQLVPGVGLAEIISERRVGQRITIRLIRPSPEGLGEEAVVGARLSAMPTTDELVYRRLFDRALPGLTLFDAHGAVVPVADWTRRPQVWMVFDARCDACAGAAA